VGIGIAIALFNRNLQIFDAKAEIETFNEDVPNLEVSGEPDFYG
jgi:hypothetical protein